MDWSRHMRPIIERLGEDTTLRSLATTGTATVRALYIAPFARALDIVPTNRPQVAFMSNDAPDLAMGDLITLRGTEYRVVEVQPDPVSEVTVCPLEEV